MRILHRRKSSSWYKVDKVCPYRSPLPVGRRGVFYSFKCFLYLPLLRLHKGGGGASALWVNGTALLYTDYRTDWRGEGKAERGVTPLTCCDGWRSSGKGRQLIPWWRCPQSYKIQGLIWRPILIVFYSMNPVQRRMFSILNSFPSAGLQNGKLCVGINWKFNFNLKSVGVRILSWGGYGNSPNRWWLLNIYI
jgi:hypothetical protein